MPVTLACGATIAEPGDVPGSLIAGPRQLEYAGVLTGSGTPYRWRKLTGWDSLPGVDLADTPKATDHGDWAGLGLYTSRTVTYELQIRGDTVELMEEAIAVLRDRWVYTGDQPLVVRDSAQTLVADARILQRDIEHNPERTVGIMSAAVQWRCADPFRRATWTRTVTLVPADPEGIGGVSYPVTYPVDYGTLTLPYAAELANTGSAAAAPVVMLYGPGEDWSLILGDGQRLRCTLPLVAGDVVRIDTRDGSVVLNGTDRSGWLAADSVPAEEWRIPAGGSSVLLLVAAGTTETSRAVLEWTDTWA